MSVNSGQVLLSNPMTTSGLHLDDGATLNLGSEPIPPLTQRPVGVAVPPVVPIVLLCNWMIVESGATVQVTAAAASSPGSTTAITTSTITLNGNALLNVALDGYTVGINAWNRIYTNQLIVSPAGESASETPSIHFDLGWSKNDPLPYTLTPLVWLSGETVSTSTFLTTITAQVPSAVVYPELVFGTAGGNVNYLISLPITTLPSTADINPSSTAAGTGGNQPTSGGGGLSGGAKAGIAFAVIFSVGGIAGAVWYFRFRRTREDPLLDASYAGVNN